MAAGATVTTALELVAFLTKRRLTALAIHRPMCRPRPTQHLGQRPPCYEQRDETSNDAQHLEPNLDIVARDTAIRELEAAWSNAAGAKQLETALTFYSPDAASFYPNVPVATSMEAIRKNWAEMLALPGVSAGWQVSRVEVAAPGTMGWAYEHIEFQRSSG